ncbi:NAD(P)H-dependent oxidoreductase [Massilia sp. S19_KUP03_FR1]|uniref:NAD(P)H-dependent oxidoreductase n=1 Tax=Massilia sp. S19_KUP03_FR1 TaxID=3025503 RepID=UPI002FCD9A79
MTDLIDKLHWRYATKKFNPAKQVPDETIERILEAVRLTPSSSGLQPYELILVTNPALRAQIKSVAWDQQQVVDCSHLLVFAAWDDITADRVNAMYDLMTEERGFNEGLDAYRQRLLGIVAARGKEANYEAAARQAYIGLGAALIAAAFEGVDATPMEGFDPTAVDTILGLGARQLRSVLIVPFGYRDEEGDWLVKMKKVRRARADFVTDMR